jgi:hypothetical protein
MIERCDGRFVRDAFLAACGLGSLFLVNYFLAVAVPFRYLETRMSACLWFGAIAPLLHGVFLFLAFRVENKGTALALGIYGIVVYLAFAIGNVYVVHQMAIGA